MDFDKSNSDQVRRSVAAQMILRLTPTLRESVCADTSFMENFGWAPRVNPLRTQEIPRRQFYEMLRASEAAPKLEYVITDGDGSDRVLVCERSAYGSLIVKEGSATAELLGIALLFENRDLRLSAFDSLVSGETFDPQSFARWREVIERRRLSDAEFEEFGLWMGSGLSHAMSDVVNRIVKEGGFRPTACLPASEETFLAILPKPAQNSKGEDYVSLEYLERVKELSTLDLHRALIFIGPTCFLPMRELSALFSNVPAEEFISVATSIIESNCDPFTAALILDVVCQRIQEGEAFEEVGRKAIHLVVGGDNQLSRMNFIIALLAVLQAFFDDGMFKAEPLFFRRMTAWTWAGIVARLIAELEFDREAVLKELLEFCPAWLKYAGALDRLESPNWRSEWMSPGNISGICRRRVLQSIVEHRLSADITPESWKLSLNKARSGLSVGFELYPGPFDDLLSASFQLGSPTEAVENTIFESDANQSDLIVALRIINLIQIFSLSASAVDKITEWLRKVVDISSENGEEIVACKSRIASHIAAVHKSEAHARLAIDAARELRRKNPMKYVQNEVYSILDASCACANELDQRKFVRDEMLTTVSDVATADVGERILSILDLQSKIRPELRPYLARICARLRILTRNFAK